MRPSASAVILIALGVLFLMHNLGFEPFNIGRLIATWWPVILIALGLQMLFKRK